MTFVDVVTANVAKDRFIVIIHWTKLERTAHSPTPPFARKADLLIVRRFVNLPHKCVRISAWVESFRRAPASTEATGREAYRTWSLRINGDLPSQAEKTCKMSLVPPKWFFPSTIRLVKKR
jgi:hypothetical protein